MKRLFGLSKARLALAVTAPLVLTQCGLLSSAAGLLTAPLRMAGGLVMEEGAGEDGGWQSRGREVEARGVFRGRGEGEAPGETAAGVAWSNGKVERR